MNHKGKMKCKIISWKLLLPLLIAFAGSCIGGVYAWYSSSSIVESPMHMNYNIVLYDEYTDDTESWSTGKAVSKEVYVINEGGSDAFLRLFFTEVWQEGIDGGGYYTAVINGQETVIKTWADTGLSNMEYWTYNNADGYYYYNYVLKPGERVDILKSITFNPDTAEFVAGGRDTNPTNRFIYNLDFVKESIQATTEACKSLWGYEPNVNDAEGKVTWQF